MGFERRLNLFLLVALALAATGCAKEHAVSFEMRWSAGDDPGHVYLDFVDFPNHYVDIQSLELESHLRGLGTDRIAVGWTVRTRLGCVLSIRETSIDDRDDWPRIWAGSGWVGEERPSPWDRFECRIPWW